MCYAQIITCRSCHAATARYLGADSPCADLHRYDHFTAYRQPLTIARCTPCTAAHEQQRARAAAAIDRIAAFYWASVKARNEHAYGDRPLPLSDAAISEVYRLAYNRGERLHPFYAGRDIGGRDRLDAMEARLLVSDETRREWAECVDRQADIDRTGRAMTAQDWSFRFGAITYNEPGVPFMRRIRESLDVQTMIDRGIVTVSEEEREEALHIFDEVRNILDEGIRARVLVMVPSWERRFLEARTALLQRWPPALAGPRPADWFLRRVLEGYALVALLEGRFPAWTRQQLTDLVSTMEEPPPGFMYEPGTPFLERLTRRLTTEVLPGQALAPDVHWTVRRPEEVDGLVSYFREVYPELSVAQATALVRDTPEPPLPPIQRFAR